MSQPPHPPPPPLDAEEEWQRWRTETLTKLLWTTALSCAALGALTTVQVRSVPFAIVVAVISTVMLLAAVARRIDFRVRAAVLIAALFAGATAGLALGGLSPNILVAMCVCVVMGSLLLGPRWGMVLVLWVAGSVLVVVPLRNAGFFPHDVYFDYGRPAPATIIRVAIIFVLLSTALVSSIAYLLARAYDLFIQKGRALRTLEEEQARRQEADAQLLRAETAFRKAQELEILGRLASSVAHDFNNALLIIQANADFARLRPATLDASLRDIGVAIRQATATTRQLRAFSPQAQCPPRPVSLAETLAREATLLRQVLPANIALRYERPAGDFMVLGDEGQIQSILTNLALNARDAMPEGGSLEIRLRPATAGDLANGDAGGDTGGYSVIDVIDDGSGMSPETTTRIFEPFFTTKGPAGSGLGLASVRTIVEKAGGNVLVASEAGAGTHFRIVWPRLAEDVSAPRVEEVDDAPAPPSAAVLVVDDDPAVRGTMARSLAFGGYTVLEAGTGDEALTLARKHDGEIEVLCLEMVLPGMAPRRLIESFRATHPDARVLLCSGYAPEAVGVALDTVDGFLPKPFSPSALATAVRDLIVRKREAVAARKTAG